MTNDYKAKNDPVFYVSAAETEPTAEFYGWTPGWYFWNEVWSDEYGPYDTQDTAREALVEYVKSLMTPVRALLCNAWVFVEDTSFGGCEVTCELLQGHTGEHVYESVDYEGTRYRIVWKHDDEVLPDE